MSANNAGMGQLLNAIVVALIVAMFFAGGFMVAETTSKEKELKGDDGKTGIIVEPKKMYFGIAMIIAAALLAIAFVYSLYKGSKNGNRGYGNNYEKILSGYA